VDDAAAAADDDDNNNKTPENSHTGHCTHTLESTNVKVQ